MNVSYLPPEDVLLARRVAIHEPSGQTTLSIEYADGKWADIAIDRRTFNSLKGAFSNAHTILETPR